MTRTGLHHRPRSSGGSRVRHRGAELGQATVELALGLPVLFLGVLLVVQVGLIVAMQVRTVHAAREAARAAAVEPAPAAARTAALASSGLDPRRTTVVVHGRDGPGSLVTARVRVRMATDLPLVGPLVPDGVLEASATMRVET